MKKMFKYMLTIIIVFNFIIVNDINAEALGDKHNFEEISISSFASGNEKFKSGVFDGTNIWLIPYNSDNLLKYNIATGGVSSYSVTDYVLGEAKFKSGVFDGTNIWLIPYQSDKLIKVNTITGEMIAIPLQNPNDNFIAGIYDGVSLWLIPHTSDNLIKVNVSNNEMLALDTRLYTDTVGASTPQFVSAEIIGTNIWLIPANTNKLLKVEPNNNDSITSIDISSYNSGKNTRFDMNSASISLNNDLWIIPKLDNKIIKYNTSDITKNSLIDTSSYLNLKDDGNGNMSGNVFTSAIYDGSNIWLYLNNSTSESSALIKIDPNTNVTSKYSLLSNVKNDDYYGSVFDGNNVYLIPNNSDKILKISTDTTVDVMYEVIKKFRTTENKKISDDVVENVSKNSTYTTSKNQITGYVYIGYTLNDGPLQSGEIKIENINSSHKVTLIYGQSDVLPQTGINIIRNYLLGGILLIIGIFFYIKFIVYKNN